LTAFAVSVQAENDLDEIVGFTLTTWGPHQADIYLTRLEDGFQLLAEHPAVGRPVDSLRKGLRRFEIGRHVVFYMPEANGILIVRVLHESMLPGNYF
jgi:toxin ParE1/3/4